MVNDLNNTGTPVTAPAKPVPTTYSTNSYNMEDFHRGDPEIAHTRNGTFSPQISIGQGREIPVDIVRIVQRDTGPFEGKTVIQITGHSGTSLADVQKYVSEINDGKMIVQPSTTQAGQPTLNLIVDGTLKDVQNHKILSKFLPKDASQPTPTPKPATQQKPTAATIPPSENLPENSIPTSAQATVEKQPEVVRRTEAFERSLEYTKLKRGDGKEVSGSVDIKEKVAQYNPDGSIRTQGELRIEYGNLDRPQVAGLNDTLRDAGIKNVTPITKNGQQVGVIVKDGDLDHPAVKKAMEKMLSKSTQAEVLAHTSADIKPLPEHDLNVSRGDNNSRVINTENLTAEQGAAIIKHAQSSGLEVSSGQHYGDAIIVRTPKASTEAQVDALGKFETDMKNPAARTAHNTAAEAHAATAAETTTPAAKAPTRQHEMPNTANRGGMPGNNRLHRTQFDPDGMPTFDYGARPAPSAPAAAPNRQQQLMQEQQQQQRQHAPSEAAIAQQQNQQRESQSQQKPEPVKAEVAAPSQPATPPTSEVAAKSTGPSTSAPAAPVEAPTTHTTNTAHPEHAPTPTNHVEAPHTNANRGMGVAGLGTSANALYNGIENGNTSQIIIGSVGTISGVADIAGETPLTKVVPGLNIVAGGVNIQQGLKNGNNQQVGEGVAETGMGVGGTAAVMGYGGAVLSKANLITGAAYLVYTDVKLSRELAEEVGNNQILGEEIKGHNAANIDIKKVQENIANLAPPQVVEFEKLSEVHNAAYNEQAAKMAKVELVKTGRENTFYGDDINETLVANRFAELKKAGKAPDFEGKQINVGTQEEVADRYNKINDAFDNFKKENGSELLTHNEFIKQVETEASKTEVLREQINQRKQEAQYLKDNRTWGEKIKDGTTSMFVDEQATKHGMAAAKAEAADTELTSYERALKRYDKAVDAEIEKGFKEKGIENPTPEQLAEAKKEITEKGEKYLVEKGYKSAEEPTPTQQQQPTPAQPEQQQPSQNVLADNNNQQQPQTAQPANAVASNETPKPQERELTPLENASQQARNECATNGLPPVQDNGRATPDSSAQIARAEQVRTQQNSIA